MTPHRLTTLCLVAGLSTLSFALLAGAQDGAATKSAKTVTASGLTIIDQGRDDAGARAGDTVTVHYTGKLDDGTVFDSSLKGDRSPFSFEVGAHRVIAGWDEGLIGMRPGDRRQLVIPGNLAYGERGSPPRIPANATLTFDIQMLYITHPADAGGAPPAR